MDVLSQCTLNKNRLVTAMTNETLYLRRKVMMKKSMFVLLLVCGLLLSVPAQGEVTITPTNVQLPTATGEDLSFDFAINDPCGFTSQGFQSTITYSGPGTLTFDDTSSKTVTGETNYWLFGSPIVEAFEDAQNAGNYIFGDSPDDSIARTLAVDNIMARYVFQWDGTPGGFTFNIDLNTSKSYIQDEFWGGNAIAFDPGRFTGGSNWFTVTIPEPATLMLLGLGATVLLRKRRA